MTFFATAEIRWFGPGPVPESVQAWYDRLTSPGAAQPARTDHYLRDTGAGLGIKLREGRVELKQRNGAPEPLQLSSGIGGVVEAWRKWSFALEDPRAGLAAMGRTPEAWIAVRKRRTLKTYGVDETGAVWSGSGDAQATCEVELAQVTRDDEQWWTVGLECAGRSGLRRPGLLAVAAHVVGSAGALRLPPGDSYGYARWLSEPAGRSRAEE